MCPENGGTGVGTSTSWYENHRWDLGATARAGIAVACGFFLFVSPSRHDSASTDPLVAKYWAQAGLNETHLSDFFSKSCSGNTKEFLACFHALSVVAERQHVSLRVVDPRRTPWRLEIRPKRLSFWLEPTERERLRPFSEALNQLLLKQPEMTSRLSEVFLFSKSWQTLIQRERGNERRSALSALALNAYWSVQADPHTYVLPSSYYQHVLANQEQRSAPAGIIVGRDSMGVFVQRVLVKSSAEAAGVRPGDRIVLLGGFDAKTLDRESFFAQLREGDGKNVRIQLQRLASSKLYEVLLPLREQETGSVHLTSVQRNGREFRVLTVEKFARGVCSTARSLIGSEQASGSFGLILDLRDNLGGQMREAACLLSAFLPKDSYLFEAREFRSNGISDYYFAEEEPVFHGPLTVLINAQSASASEIVAGVLQESRRATIVGQPSFGKGSYQDGEALPGFPRVTMFRTRGLYHFPSGATPQGVGVIPDLLVGEQASGRWERREHTLYWSAIAPPSSLHDNVNRLSAVDSKSSLRAAQVTEADSGDILSLTESEPTTPQIPDFGGGDVYIEAAIQATGI